MHLNLVYNLANKTYTFILEWTSVSLNKLIWLLFFIIHKIYSKIYNLKSFCLLNYSIKNNKIKFNEYNIYW